MRLLLIEDENTLRNDVENYFLKQKFAVETAADGVDGAFLACENDYDAAIVDIGLPKKDGVQVIKELRAAGRTYPVLILTARGHWQDKVAGLEAGADDYLVKPFHHEELRARVHALIRRSTGHAVSRLDFGRLSIDTAAKEIMIDGERVELTSYEYNTLEYLALHRDSTISKTELTEHLYHQDFERDSNVIEVFVGRLRKKLLPLNPIKTMRGQGYRFLPDE